MGIMSWMVLQYIYIFHCYCQGFGYFDGLTIEVSCSHIYGGSYKSNRLLGIRSFEYLNHEMILKLYKSLIRPTLEYGNIIWGPFFTLDQRAIECIQNISLSHDA